MTDSGGSARSTRSSAGHSKSANSRRPVPRQADSARSELDIIEWLIQCMRRKAPGITDEIAREVSREAREAWGGQRIEYVAKFGPNERAERKAAQGEIDVPAAAIQAYLDGAPLASILAEHGVSRSTFYRALKR